MHAAELERLYARQSRSIDTGDAAGWAATFTDDGEFHSPSYAEARIGTSALVAFAREYYDRGLETGTTSRHVVTNVDVEPGRDADHLVGHAYLQIVATPRGGESRLVRLTTLTDDLVRGPDGHWRFAVRRVTRDD